MKVRLSGEHLFYGGCSFLIFCFNIIPYILAFIKTPLEKVFSGQFIIYFDVPTYYAKMLAGFNGHWIYQNLYTTEGPHTAVPLYLFYLFLGHVARVTGLSIPTVFFCARIFFSIFFLAVIVWFLHVYVADKTHRRLSFFFMCFASGFGGFLFPFFQFIHPSFFNIISLDLWHPEIMSSVRFFSFPHYLFANALFLLALIGCKKIFLCEKRFFWTICIGGIFSLLACVLPFYLPVAYAVILTGIGVGYFLKKISAQSCTFILSALIISLPAFLFMFSIPLTNHLWNRIETQNTIASFPLYSYFLGWGFLSIFACVQIFINIRNRTYQERDLFLGAWIFFPFLFMYGTHFSMRGRFIEIALYIPLSILAAQYLTQWFRKKKKGGVSRRFTIGVAWFMCIFSFFVAFTLHLNLLVHTQWNDYFYYSKKTLNALFWIRDHTSKNSIVITSFYSGNLVPYYAQRFTYVGHKPETINALDKEKEVENFLAMNMTPLQAKQFLYEQSISYVLVTEYEKKFLSSQFPYDFLHEEYTNGEAKIYSIITD